jgi:hypothetical protein
MPKLNIYVDDELAKRVRDLKLPMSEISRDALWAAVEKEDGAVCRSCKQPAEYRVRRQSGTVYACTDHLATLLGTEGWVAAL